MRDKKVRRRRFVGSPEQWRYLTESWGLDAVTLMMAADDRAYYSAQLAMRFARKGGFWGVVEVGNGSVSTQRSEPAELGAQRNTLNPLDTTP